VALSAQCTSSITRPTGDCLQLPALERVTVAERERQDGVWLPAAWRGGHAAGDALGYYGEQVPIGQRVRQAHLEHFCPGVPGSP